ncbi:MAG: DUF523 domain-containing protein [Candidatus Omnitrophica bacterium]|nr:DUF523 domain-containing protein [Candidatus Omnitrophota bacterium]
MRLKFIVSACLAGVNCTYNGKNNFNPSVKTLVEKGFALPVCPEVLGGMAVPRDICELSFRINENPVVLTLKGKDVTPLMITGANKALKLARKYGIKYAILKSNSPSCGYGKIYDGSFSARLTEGDGIAAALLHKHGIKIYNEKERASWPVKYTTPG